MDVARLASVSPATVSRFLNHPSMVGDETRRTIANAIEMLGFVRNRRASSLSGTRSGVIGALVPTIGNAIFAEAIGTFEQVLKESGYGLLLASSLYDLQREHSQFVTLVEQGVDALMLVGNEHTPETYRLLDRLQLPFVQIWSFSGTSYRPEIGFDNALAAHDITEHLLQLGHQRFALITGITKDNDRATSRLAGTVDALLERGIVIPECEIVQCEYEISSAYECVLQFLNQSRPIPTALICGNDVIAHGALSACRNAGLSIPGDISIVGFGDFSFSAFLSPPLTTIRIPAKRIAQRAAEALTKSIEDHSPIKSSKIPYELKIRGTSGPAP